MAHLAVFILGHSLVLCLYSPSSWLEAHMFKIHSHFKKREMKERKEEKINCFKEIQTFEIIKCWTVMECCSLAVSDDSFTQWHFRFSVFIFIWLSSAWNCNPLGILSSKLPFKPLGISTICWHSLSLCFWFIYRLDLASLKYFCHIVQDKASKFSMPKCIPWLASKALFFTE